MEARAPDAKDEKCIPERASESSHFSGGVRDPA